MPETKIRFAPNVPQELIFKADGEYLPETEQVRYELADGRILYLDSSVAAKLNYMEIAVGERFFICKRWNGLRKPGPRWDLWLSPEAEKIRAEFQSPGSKFSCAMPETTYTPPLTPVVPEPEQIDVIPELGYTIASADLVADQKIVALQNLSAAQRSRQLQNVSLEEQLRLSQVAILPPALSQQNRSSLETPRGDAKTEPPSPGLNSISVQSSDSQEPLQTGTHGPQRIPRKLSSIPTRVPYNQAFREVLHFVLLALKEEHAQWGDQAVQDIVSSIIIDSGKREFITLWERSVEA